MKKFWSILLALMLVMSMTTVFASADDEGATTTTTPTTYTITVPNNHHTYEILQIFKGDLSDGKLTNMVWGANGTGTENAPVDDTTIKSLTDTSDSSDKEKLAVITTLLSNTTPFATIGEVKDPDDDTQTIFTASASVPAGYYLIRDLAGSLSGKDDSYTLAITKVVGNVEIQPKADKPSMIKKIKDKNDTSGTTSDWQDSADHDIGDAVPFRLTATIPSNFANYSAYKFVFHDTMEEGLTFNEDTVKVYVNESTVPLKKDTDYTLSKADDQNFTVTFDDLAKVKYKETEEGNDLEIKKGDQIHVEYTATLNEKAEIGKHGNLNTAYLEYSNNPNAGGENEMGRTPDDTVIVFTYKLVINKVHNVTTQDGGSDLAPLAGAEFKLEKSLGNDQWLDITLTKNTDGTVFTAIGLDDGDYKLTEITAPAGYNKLSAPIVFTVTGTHTTSVNAIDNSTRDGILTAISGDTTSGSISFDYIRDNNGNNNMTGLTTNIVNKSGATLPETGGIGTTIFYVLGGLMFVGAALTLVVRRKAEADEI